MCPGQSTFLPPGVIHLKISACSGRRSLRSAARGDFMVPRAHTAIRQRRDFSIVGPSTWNTLSSDLPSLPGTCLVLSINSLKPFFLIGLGRERL